jgi:HlyD family secretion protein
MNGQVVMDIVRKDNVLAVPSDAIRNARDAATVAPVLGVNPDSLKSMLAAGRRGGSGGAGGEASSTAAAGGVTDTSRRGRFGGGAGTGGGGMQVVFVKAGGKYTPRMVRTGISDFDYTEILSGVSQGEQVALLGPALLQAQREQQQQRIRAGTGGGLQQQTTPAAGGGGGAGGGRTGGGRTGG